MTHPGLLVVLWALLLGLAAAQTSFTGPFVITAQYLASDTTCQSPVFVRITRTAGVCLKTFDSSIGTRPAAGSSMTVYTATTKTVNTYLNDFCSGAPDSSISTNLPSTLGTCTPAGNWYTKTWNTNSLPQEVIQIQSGMTTLLYSSDASKCATGKEWTSAIIGTGLFCEDNYGSNEYNVPGTSQEIAGWGNPMYLALSSCSADLLSGTFTTYGDNKCTSKTSTATFYGDTGGSASTTLTIRNAFCVNEADSNNACSSNNPWQKAVGGQGSGAAGFIEESMTLTWMGKTGTAITIQPGSCRFTYATSAATCTLSSSVNIPSNTLITGSLQQTRPDRLEGGSAQCVEYSEQYYKKDDSMFYRRTYCGSVATALLSLPPTTVAAASMGTPPKPGILTITTYSNEKCQTLVSTSSMAMGACVQETANGAATGGSYLQLVGSKTISTQYFANAICNGTAGRSTLQTTPAYTGLINMGNGTGTIGSCVRDDSRGRSDVWVKVSAGPAWVISTGYSSNDACLTGNYASMNSYGVTLVGGCQPSSPTGSHQAVLSPDMTSWWTNDYLDRNCTMIDPKAPSPWKRTISNTCSGGSIATITTTNPEATIAGLFGGVSSGLYLRYYYNTAGSCLAKASDWNEIIAMKIGLNGQNCDSRGYPVTFNAAWTCPPSGVGMLVVPRNISGSHAKDCSGALAVQTPSSNTPGTTAWIEGDCGMNRDPGQFVRNVLPSCSASASVPGLSGDGAALCDFWQTVPPASQAVLKNWCQGSAPFNPCATGTSAWFGVACSSVNGATRVTSLAITSAASLSGGVIPGSIALLDALPSLQLSGSLSGTIPATMAGLTALTSLTISNSKITGRIPSQLALLQQLKTLALFSNKLSRRLPSSLGDLAALTQLDVSGNSIGGSPIPSSIGALTRLAVLLLENNAFTGSVPASFCSFTGSKLSIKGNPGLACAPLCLSTLNVVQKDAALTAACDAAWVVSATYSSNTGCINANSSQLISYSATRVGACYGSSGSSMVTVSADRSQYTKTDFSDHTCTKLFVPPGSTNPQTRSFTGVCSPGIYGGMTLTTYTTTLPPVTTLAPVGSYMRLRYPNSSSCLSINGDWAYAMLTKSIEPFCSTGFRAPGANSINSINALLSCTPSGIGMQIEAHGFGNGSYCGGVKGATNLVEAACTFADNMYYLDVLSGCPLNPSLVSRTAWDGAALCDFYNTVPSAGQSLLLNWCKGEVFSYNPCSTTSVWRGVTCETVGGAPRVTGVSLGYTQLGGGSLPTTIGNLDALTLLDVYYNNLGGGNPLPTQLFQLKSLARLDLGWNNWWGPLPSQIGQLSALTYLGLYTNHFTSTLPTQIWKMTNLKKLDASNNALIGSIPSDIGGMASLTSLRLGSTSLGGSLPSHLGLLTGLDWLSLSYSRFTGTIPTELGNLKLLEALYLGSNSLQGTLPGELFSISTLRNVYLESNAFVGPVPFELCNLPTTINMNISSNPGLTCLPPCLTAAGAYASLLRSSKLTAVCSPAAPTSSPAQPTGQPSAQPSRQPSLQPSLQPSAQPSRQPSSQPSARPSVRPKAVVVLSLSLGGISFADANTDSFKLGVRTAVANLCSPPLSLDEVAVTISAAAAGDAQAQRRRLQGSTVQATVTVTADAGSSATSQLAAATPSSLTTALQTQMPTLTSLSVSSLAVAQQGTPTPLPTPQPSAAAAGSKSPEPPSVGVIVLGAAVGGALLCGAALGVAAYWSYARRSAVTDKKQLKAGGKKTAASAADGGQGYYYNDDGGDDDDHARQPAFELVDVYGAGEGEGAGEGAGGHTAFVRENPPGAAPAPSDRKALRVQGMLGRLYADSQRDTPLPAPAPANASAAASVPVPVPAPAGVRPGALSPRRLHGKAASPTAREVPRRAHHAPSASTSTSTSTSSSSSKSKNSKSSKSRSKNSRSDTASTSASDSDPGSNSDSGSDSDSDSDSDPGWETESQSTAGGGGGRRATERKNVICNVVAPDAGCASPLTSIVTMLSSLIPVEPITDAAPAANRAGPPLEASLEK